MNLRGLNTVAAAVPARGAGVPVGEGPRISVLVLLIITLGLFGLFFTRRTDMATTPYVNAQNQAIVHGTVTVHEVQSPGPGWVVVYRSDNGVVGELIGFTPVPVGRSQAIIVPVNASRATPVMYVILHRDLGTPRLFEYPGADDPVVVNGVVIMDQFQVTGIQDDPSVPSPLGTEPTPDPLPTIPTTEIQSVTVLDQPLVAETVTVERVVAHQRSWVTIHADENGEPGMILGAEGVMPGETRNIVIPLNVYDMTPMLHAVLYADLGTPGAFEIPGADLPVVVNGQLVTDTFFVTGGLPLMLPAGGNALSLALPHASQTRSQPIPAAATATTVYNSR